MQQSHVHVHMYGNQQHNIFLNYIMKLEIPFMFEVFDYNQFRNDYNVTYIIIAFTAFIVS